MAAEGIGMAEVGVLKAKSLKRMDIAGLSDPYVVLSITGGGGWRKKTKKTKIIRNNLNPEWNQEFTFPVTDFEQKIELVVYDHDDLGSDDIMGYVIVPVSDFVDEDKEGWYTLLTKEREEIIGEDGSLSSVFLSFKYTAHASEEEIALSQDVYTGLAGGEDAIKDSIKKAAGSSPKRRILLQIGADWSSSCKKFYRVLKNDEMCSSLCSKYYVYTLLDAENEKNFSILRKLGEPQVMWLGFPVFVIIDSNGAYIHTQGSGVLETEPWVTGGFPDRTKVL